AVLSLNPIQSRKQNKTTSARRLFYFGSGDWIRTSDLVVTLIPYFHTSVDYLITIATKVALGTRRFPLARTSQEYFR
ncbi:MAG TPA: hypothetical protein VLH86_06435, partial [Patescibacteria group bacterium]|nr:hypothetical protein [Patescibacteria group bacterium]